ncbi:MAG: folate family ECF transporter S component [Clostridiales bacterium]|jgi:ECF transporter S component (folate family)|nr:folate family ECF transporter S component [Clostridiales bacterium]
MDKRLDSPRTLGNFFRKRNLFSLRHLTFMGLMIAISVVLGQLDIYANPSFRLFSISYLPGVIVAMLCGPWEALAYGLIKDLLVFITNPHGPYFPGYALSEMLTYFIYAYFLYQKPILLLRNKQTVRYYSATTMVLYKLGFALGTIAKNLTYNWRVFVSYLIVTISITLGLGYIWLSILYGKPAGEFYTGVRLINQLWQFPLHVFLIIITGHFCQKNLPNLLRHN